MLTVKQEKFVQNLIKGMSQREAYRDAYPNNKSKDKIIDESASRLFNDSKILTRYNELLQKSEDETIMSAIERKRWLSKVINGEIKENEREAYLSDKMKAMDILNKMSGEYVTKIEGDLNTDVNINIELTDE